RGAREGADRHGEGRAHARMPGPGDVLSGLASGAARLGRASGDRAADPAFRTEDAAGLEPDAGAYGLADDAPRPDVPGCPARQVLRYGGARDEPRQPDDRRRI